jgi:ribosomal protein S18 acetylase RimI-like enzyme
MLEKYEEQLPEDNIFMYCNKINKEAFTILTDEYNFRYLYKTELEIWKSLPFDDNYTETYEDFMTDYYNNVYKIRENEFYNKCIVVCNKNDEIIGSCFLWKLDEKINTLHWLKVKKEYEGKGIGRALISKILENIRKTDLPIFLHTQPGSYRAIKLYSDFGFKIITNDKIGNRINNIDKCITKLIENIPEKYFRKIKYIKVSKRYLDIFEEKNLNDF